MRKFAKDARGNAAIFVAIAMSVLLGMGALGVDTASFYSDKSQLQNAADAAALGAGLQLRDQPAAKLAAINLANKNVPARFGAITTPEDVVFGKFDVATKVFTASAVDVNAVRVTAKRNALRGNAAPTFLGRIFGVGTVDISATAIAAGSTGPCMIVLEKTAKEALKVQGNGTVNIPSCGVYVNSSNNMALKQQGAGWIKSKSIQVVGDYFPTGNYSVTPQAKQKVLADPLAGVPEPTIPAGCTYTNKTFTTATTIPAGSTFCGNITFSADIEFASGIQYFKGATVITLNATSLTGNEVMLYFDGTSSFDARGSGSVTLTAPQSGVYKGISIFGSRSGTLSDFKFVGNSGFFIAGTIYLPTANLEFYGTSDVSVTSKSGYVIAQRFLFQGDSSMTFDSWGTDPSGLAAKQSALVW